MTNRLTRVNELLRREIGELLFKIMTESEFDLAAVTVTHVLTSSNLRHARVLVSIRGTPARQKDMLRLLWKHRPEIQARINRDINMKYTPRLEFELDPSVAQGDHVLDVLHQLERETRTGGTDAETPDAPPADDSED